LLKNDALEKEELINNETDECKGKFVEDNFEKLKEDVVSIQNDLKESELYNKKLEEYIYKQVIV